MGARSPHVLVVDDERFFREAIQEILTGAGFQCALAASGEEALALAQDPALAVAVIDVRLPGIGGVEVLRRLRTARPDLRALMLSAHTEREPVLEALRLGACDYLAKPIHDEELVLAVRRALEGFDLARNAGRLRERLGSLESRMVALAGLAGEPDDGGAEILCARAAEAAADVLRADKTSLMLADPAGERLRVAGATGRELALSEFDPRNVGEGVAGRVFARGEPLLVADSGSGDGFAGRSAAGERYRSGSFALAPLRSGDRFLGVLCATDPVERESFDWEDLALLRILALGLASILQPETGRPGEAPPAMAPAETAAGTTPAGDESPEADADAELARLVCDAVTVETEPERVFDAALRPVARMLGAESAAVFLREARSGALVRQGQSEPDAAADRERLPGGRGLTGTVLETGRPVATAEPAADPRFDPEVDTPASGESGPLLCLPLRLQGRTLGVFRAFPTEPERASTRTTEVLGAALSAALRSALLYRRLVEGKQDTAAMEGGSGEPNGG